MPLIRRGGPASPTLAASAAWLPQPFGRKSFRQVEDPLIEPLWGGVRVLAHLQPGASGSAALVITDETGEDCTAEFDALAGAIAAALHAEDAVLDGYLTVEPTQNQGHGLPDWPQAPTPTDLAAQLLVGRRAGPERKPPLDPDRPIAFVAVDLLRIDGSDLIELPLLERKRLLDAALEPGELVRVTPYVRPPVGSHAGTWFAQGFREMAYKPANGRYRTDGKPGDWASAPIMAS